MTSRAFGILSVAAMLGAVGLGLAACSSHGYDHIAPWSRAPEPNPAAGQTQAVVARQAKEAKCKGEVDQRPGSTGTNPGDYKCKRFTS